MKHRHVRSPETDEKQEPGVVFATVREGENDFVPCWDIECRLEDGQKFAVIQVDYDFPKLTDYIAETLTYGAPMFEDPNLKAKK